MSNKKILTYVFLLLCNSLVLHAQDIHFSHYQTLSPLLNPALTGFIPQEGHFRVAAISRNQWSSFLETAAFQTNGFSFDMRNCLLSNRSNKTFNGSSNKHSGPTWGFGFSYVHDEAGTRSVKNIANASFPLIRDYANLNASMIFPINDNFYLNGGFRFGGIFNRLQTQHLRYDEQFDGLGGFDASIAGEFDGLNQLNTQMMDIGGGAAVFYFGKKWGANLGMAFDHIFIPVQYQFTDNAILPELARKYSWHAKISGILHQKGGNRLGLSIKSLLARQSPYQQFLLKGDFYYQSGDEFNIALGSGWRTSHRLLDQQQVDAVFVSCALFYKTFTLGFNYDINVSGLSAVSRSYGAFEFSLVYHWQKKNSKCFPAIEGCKLNGKNVHPIFF